MKMDKKKMGRSLGRPKMSESEIPTNELILKTAAHLFLENGFQKVSIDDVAKEAGLTKASVYYYFGSKAELFKEVMIALMGRIQENIIRLLGSDKSLYDRLFEVLMAHLKATMTIDLEGFMRESKTSLSAEQIKEMKLAEEKMYLSIEEAIADAAKKGEIPPINSKFAAHSYIALTQVGNYKQPNGLPIFPEIEEAATKIMDVFWKGFFGER
jgi:AcrR family transcriptional regulator